MEDRKKEIGKNIRNTREQLGLSQSQLAEKVGKKSTAFIAYVEAGERNISTLDLLTIARVLETTVSELVGEVETSDAKVSMALRSDLGLNSKNREKVIGYYEFLRSKEDSGDNEKVSITDPRYKEAEAKAHEVWKELGESEVPTNLQSIVKKLGIPVKKVEGIDIEGLAFSSRGGEVFIMFNGSDPLARRRFTVAHEIGHFLLDHIPIEGATEQISQNAQEKEANTFSSHLLVPRADLKEFVKNKNKTLEDIVGRYNVSKEVATYAVLNTRGILDKLALDPDSGGF